MYRGIRKQKQSLTSNKNSYQKFAQEQLKENSLQELQRYIILSKNQNKELIQNISASKADNTKSTIQKCKEKETRSNYKVNLKCVNKK